MIQWQNALHILNKKIADVTKKRNAILSSFRLHCKHLRLVELDSGPPKRICADCGAEERGWYCGYHVLVMNGDPYEVPHKKDRVIIRRTTDDSVFYGYRQNGPLYPVGQSHPNFPGGGEKSYEQLTEVTS